MCRLQLLLLAAHTLSPQQRSTLAAGAMLTVHGLASASHGRSTERQCDADPSLAAAGQPAHQILPKQTAATALLGSLQYLLVHAGGEVPTWLTLRAFALLQVGPHARMCNAVPAAARGSLGNMIQSCFENGRGNGAF